MKFTYDNGGRGAAGFKGHTGDCVARAIAIAAQMPYSTVYDAINQTATTERPRKGVSRSSARTGVYKATIKRLLTGLGWAFTPTMGIGTGCQVHLNDGELPMGRLIVSVSKHYTCVIDGVIHDTHDPQRYTHVCVPDHGQALKPEEWRNENGIWHIARRCVYGYWSKA